MLIHRSSALYWCGGCRAARHWQPTHLGRGQPSRPFCAPLAPALAVFAPVPAQPDFSKPPPDGREYFPSVIHNFLKFLADFSRMGRMRRNTQICHQRRQSRRKPGIRSPSCRLSL
jgi:hypothetical protein